MWYSGGGQGRGAYEHWGNGRYRAKGSYWIKYNEKQEDGTLVESDTLVKGGVCPWCECRPKATNEFLLFILITATTRRYYMPSVST